MKSSRALSLALAGFLLLGANAPTEADARAEYVNEVAAAPSLQKVRLAELELAVAALRSHVASLPEYQREAFLGAIAKPNLDPYRSEREALHAFPRKAISRNFRIIVSDSQTANPLQSVIDAAHALLFTSPSGKMLCEFSDGRADQMRSLFGVSLAAAEGLSKECAAVIRGTENAFHELPQRKFVLLLSRADEIVLSGLTIPENLTLLALDSAHLTAAGILGVLSHELAIRFDGIYHSQLSFLAYYPEWALKDQSELPSLECASEQTQVKEALRMRRAFAFEWKIMQELGFQQVGADWNMLGLDNESCKAELIHLLPMAKNYLDTLEGTSFARERKMNCSRALDATSAIEQLGRVELIWFGMKDSVGFGEARPPSMCQVFSSYNLILDLINPIRIGPRPNMAGGWGGGSQGRGKN